jgi:hypothetical protein
VLRRKGAKNIEVVFQPSSLQQGAVVLRAKQGHGPALIVPAKRMDGCHGVLDVSVGAVAVKDIPFTRSRHREVAQV